MKDRNPTAQADRPLRFSITPDPTDYATVGLDVSKIRPTTATQELIARFAALIARAAQTCAGLLSRAEWNALAGALNGTLWPPETDAKSLIVGEVIDVHARGGLEDLDVDQMLGTLGSMSDDQAEAVGVAIRWFWDHADAIDPGRDLWWTVAFRRRATASRNR